MCQTPDWSVGDRYLRENVPELAPLVDRYSPCPLKPKSKEVYFTILLTGIIAQQLPPDVSQQLMKSSKPHRQSYYAAGSTCCFRRGPAQYRSC